MRYYREDYTDFEWYNLMIKLGEDLPGKYDDLFDEYGEICDEYWDIFHVNVYVTMGEKI